jgi:phosphoribosyl 1,2-cyclic phosphate phosphodiesterase
MFLEFLGTGTSAGVPVLGCDCAVCTSDDPRDRRLRTSAALRFKDPDGDDRVILLDCGPDFRQQALRSKLERLDTILFTHNHVDHTWGLDEVRRFNVTMQAPIDIYADTRTTEHLRRVYAHIFDRANNVNDSFVATLIAHRFEAYTPFEMFGLKITPVTVLHGKLPVNAFRFDDAGASATNPGLADLLPLAYCTDLSAIPTESWAYLRGMQTLVLDCLRWRKHPTHLTVGQAISIAHEIGATCTRFVHMTHDIGHKATDPQLPEGMALAYDGMVLPAEA